jgi:FMN-dependent NADH-azoreductase
MKKILILQMRPENETAVSKEILRRFVEIYAKELKE